MRPTTEGEPPAPFVMTMNYQSYDQVGNRLTANDFGGAITYTYDALDRLESVDPGNQPYYPANGARTWFAYDSAGNRTDFGPQSGPGSFISPHTTYSYDPEKRLTGIELDSNPAESFGYDANGHAVSWTPQGGSARTLGYDAVGRLVSITGGFGASYAYDPFGRRIQKTEQGVTTRSQYDGLDVVAEYSASQLEATYVFGPGIDEVLKLRRGTTVAAYHTDGLGSVVAMSVDGTLRNTYRYDAFGKAVAEGGSSPLALRSSPSEIPVGLVITRGYRTSTFQKRRLSALSADLILAVLRDEGGDVPFTHGTLGQAVVRWLERTYRDVPLLDALTDARGRTPPAEDFALLRRAHARAWDRRRAETER